MRAVNQLLGGELIQTLTSQSVERFDGFNGTEGPLIMRLVTKGGGEEEK